ncbi:P-loop NTPase fold protein [Fusobacterium varium]|uniref:P-loop NTPase fold protein n=1 Tax=Fusobacterium varium TaxID=856 RepID=UPI00242A7203|nr:P-loop NTPase fold protein [Fusobacterium varium]
MIMLKNIKKILFKVYLIYTIAYIFDFVLRHRILHFEDWSFLIMILFLFSISIFKHAYESFLIFIISFIIAIFFKVGSFSEGLKIFELYSENFFSIRTFLFIIFSIMMCYFNFKNEKKNIENIEELYEERKEDLEYIQRFIKNDERKVNVLGIDGEFGTGKTFLIEKSMENLKSNNNYEFIKIRCLLLERDEVYSYITQQLDRVLKKNLIFTGHFEKLKNSLIKGMDNKLFGGLSDILISENLLDDIENFKKHYHN